MTGTPLTRRQIREAERARSLAAAAGPQAPVPAVPVDAAPEVVAPAAGPVAAAPVAVAPTAPTAPLAGPAPTAPTGADATPTAVVPACRSRKDLRIASAQAPRKSRRGSSVPRAALLGTLGVLTIAAPVTGSLSHEDAEAAPRIATQTSLLEAVDAAAARAALTGETSDRLRADSTAAARARVAQASRASERQDLAEETLGGASGIAAAVAPEPEPEPEPAPEPEAEQASSAVVMPLEAGSYRITSRYGYRSYPIAGMHTGTDFAAPLDTPIRAVADGVVTYVGAGKDGRSSMLIIVEHEIAGKKVWTWYNHMFSSGLYAVEGQQVKAGDVIAGVGNNGRSTGPHLHFEVHLDDDLTTTEPLAWLAAQGAS